MQIISQNYLRYRVYIMPEQIIDIRQRIEKMRIKFENEEKLYNNENFEKENSVKKNILEENNINNFSQSEEKNINKKSYETNTLKKKDIVSNNDTNFPSVSLSVKNPISSKILVILMLLQVFSNIGIFVLLYNVLE